MHAIDELAAKAVPEEPKPATSTPSAEVAVLPPPPTRRITRSQSKVRRTATTCAYAHSGSCVAPPAFVEQERCFVLRYAASHWCALPYGVCQGGTASKPC